MQRTANEKARIKFGRSPSTPNSPASRRSWRPTGISPVLVTGILPLASMEGGVSWRLSPIFTCISYKVKLTECYSVLPIPSLEYLSAVPTLDEGECKETTAQPPPFLPPSTPPDFVRPHIPDLYSHKPYRCFPTMSAAYCTRFSWPCHLRTKPQRNRRPQRICKNTHWT